MKIQSLFLGQHWKDWLPVDIAEGGKKIWNMKLHKIFLETAYVSRVRKDLILKITYNNYNSNNNNNNSATVQ